VKISAHEDGFLLHYAGAMALVASAAIAMLPAYVVAAKFTVLITICSVLLGNLISCFSKLEKGLG
jgi:translation initiation factor 2B subunit (eIF-2B alpha/beta/delta family)